MARNKALAASALVVGMLLVVFVVVSDYPADEGSMAGTMVDPGKKIAGLEKADRSRTEQITDADVELDDASFQVLMQNDDFIEIVTSGEMALTALDKVSNTLGRESLSRAVEGGDFFQAATELERQGVSEDFARALERAGLERADMERADLERTPFNRADLERAAFERALERAGLERADMERAGLDRASLERMDLERMDLDRAELARGLERAGLNRADMERAGFDRAALDRAVSSMERATSEFGRADMEKAAGLFKSEQMRSALGDLGKSEGLARAVDGFYRSDAARSLERGEELGRGEMARGEFSRMDWNRAGELARANGLERGEDLGRGER